MTKHIANATTHPPSHVAFNLDPAWPVLSHGRDLGADEMIEPHHHPRGQLIWAADGVLRVTSGAVVWIVPSSHAVWIPGGVAHHMMTETVAKTRNLYIDPVYPVRSESHGVMLRLTPLMREVILRLSQEAAPDEAQLRNHLGLVAIDEIGRLEVAPLDLPAGRDLRLRRLIGHLVRNPAETRPLSELVQIAGASLRTIERLFQAETGMTFRQWRSRLRLLNAIELLGQGQSSTTIAYSLGFSSASAFVAAFRQHYGVPPQHFLQQMAASSR